MTRESIAIIAFNDRAWVEQPFTNEAGASRTALERLRGKLAEGTRLDLALTLAGDLVRDHHPSASAIEAVILLTDGHPNRVPPAADGRPETTVVEAAMMLRAHGARLYTVGFGSRSELNEALLCAIGDQCYIERSALSLRHLYSRLPDEIRCATE